LLTGGSGLAVVAAFMPWATATVFGITINKNGTDGDGILTLVLCGATAVMGIVMLRGSYRRALGIWAIVLLVLALFIGIYDTADVSRVASDHNGVVSVGYGLWLTDVGVVVALVGAMLWLRRRARLVSVASS